MDDKDNKNVGDGQNQEPDIIIWQKTPKNKKKSYIYEVPHESEPEKEKPEEPEEKIWGQDQTEDPVITEKKIRPVETDSDSKALRENLQDIHFDEAAEEEQKKAEKAAREQEYRRKKQEEADAAQPSDDEPVEAEHLSRQERRKRWRGRVINGTEQTSKGSAGLVRWLKRNRSRIALLILFLVVVIGGGTLFNRMRTYKKYSMDWQVSASDSGYSDYTEFCGLILHYSQDGFSVSNSSTGERLWDQAYNMDVPAVSIRDDYAVIYDVKGTSFYVLNSEGCTGYGTTDKKILKGEISSNGVVALVLDDKKANYIEYYNKDGSQIDIEIKTLITGDGYPLDIAVSPDGEELLTSYIYASDGKMLSEVVFRNFDVGKNEADRVVGGFKGYEESLVPDVMFFDDDTSAAVTEHSIDFYSTSNALNPKLSKTIDFDETINSVTSNESYVAVVLKDDAKAENEAETEAQTAEETETQAEETAAETQAEEETLSGNSNDYILKVYDQNGKKVFSDTIDFTYDKIEFSGEGLVVYNSTTCAVYDMSGVKKFEGSFGIEIKGVMRFSETTLIVYGNGALQKITLK